MQISARPLAIEEDHAADAEAEMRKCKDQFHREKATDDELAASAMLAGALLAQGKQEDAGRNSKPPSLWLPGARTAWPASSMIWHLRASFSNSERPELSRPQSEKVLRDAREHGFVGVEFQARLVLAEWEKNRDTTRRRELELAALESNARSKGFGLIARKAAAAR